MGITLHKDGDREYYRITKAWNGREIQKYVRVGRDRGKAMRRAKEIEESLEQRQRAALARKRLAGCGVLNANGRITGLQLLYRSRTGRAPWLEFKIRVKEPGRPVRFKTVSVSAHGLDTAFEMAVKRVCELREISGSTPLYQRMLAAKPLYELEAKQLAEKHAIVDPPACLSAEVVPRTEVESTSASTAIEQNPEKQDNYFEYEVALETARRQFMNKGVIRG